jgi:chromatin remodeling complex protein RSC6
MSIIYLNYMSEQTTTQQPGNQNKTDNQEEQDKRISANYDNEQNKKQESRVMSFFNQEFVDRKIDFKPRKIQNDQRNLPEDVAQIINNAKIYNKLLDIEKEIDEKVYRTRLEIQENILMPPPKVKALLRTHIFSYFIKQQINPAGEEQPQEKEEQFWILRIQGKIMPVLESQIGGFFRKFSFYFNKVQIKFQDVAGSNNQMEIDGITANTPQTQQTSTYQEIEWIRSGNVDVDGFEIKRPYNSHQNIDEIKIKILFYLNFPNQEFKVSEQLSQLLGISQDTRTRILYHLWQYIKINSLQDLENPNIILNNKELQQIFMCEKMDVTSLTSRLSDHMRLPEPIEIEYTIKQVQNWCENQKLYDFVVNIDDPHYLDISNFLSNLENDSILFPKSIFFHKTESQQKNEKNQQTFSEKFYNKVQEYDRSINDLIEKIKKHKYKYDFFDSFSKDPVKFIKNFGIQQNALLKIMKEESSIIDARWDYNSAQYYKDYEVIKIFILYFLNFPFL